MQRESGQFTGPSSSFDSHRWLFRSDRSELLIDRATILFCGKIEIRKQRLLQSSHFLEHPCSVSNSALFRPSPQRRWSDNLLLSQVPINRRYVPLGNRT